MSSGVRPGAAKATFHPNAARFPEVGMTLSAYQHAMPSSGSGGRGRFRSKFTKKRVLKAVALLAVIVIGWFGFTFYHDFSKIFHGNLFGLLHSTKLKGENVGRVNILLAGNSADDPGHGGADLTDSIMVVSIDTKDNKAFLLSIPRDLWVNIPGGGHQKINAAYVVGNSEHFQEAGYPNGGMGLLEKVVEQDFKIPINYYALVDYEGIKGAVNAVGGIDVNIHSCDPRGLYDPNRDYATGGPLVDLSNGEHHLDGEQALDLARARGDPSIYGYAYGFCDSDYTRTSYQREMLIALKNKATSVSVLANPVKVTELANSLGNNVQTDFKPSELRRLYDLSKLIPSSAIQSLSLNNVNGKSLLKSYQAYDGESALIPAAGLDDYSQIDLYIRKLISNDPVVKEGAKVVVLNATNTYGLATKASKAIEDKGADVVAVGDAPDVAAATTIIDSSGGHKPATLQMLQGLYGSRITTVNPYKNQYNADFIVVLGTDQAVQ